MRVTLSPAMQRLWRRMASRLKRAMQTAVDEEGCGAVFAAANYNQDQPTGDDNGEDQ